MPRPRSKPLTVRRDADMSDSRQAYDAWHAQVSGADALDTPWHRLVQEVLEIDRDVRGRHVLEIACGRGEFAAWCASHGRPALMLAADFSMQAVRLARSRVSAGGSALAALRFMQSDAQAIAVPSGRLDTVICCETIEHVPDPRAAIAELARVLRPGGRLFLTTPNYLGPMGAYRGYLRLTGRRYSEEGQPINHFLIAASVRRWVRRSGLRIVHTQSTGHYLPFPGRQPILLGAPARWLSPFGLHALTVAEKPVR